MRGADALAPEVEERSDEAPGAGGAAAGRAPDPEVAAKPKRRQFSAEYRLRILEEAVRCTRPGEIGRLLRHEGLYSSHLSVWRKARRNGSLKALRPKKRGAKPAESNPLSPKVRQLEAKVARLEKELATAHTIIDVQGTSDVHHGRAEGILQQRHRTLRDAWAENPERFVHRPPKPQTLPDTVWINPPHEKETTQVLTKS